MTKDSNNVNMTTIQMLSSFSVFLNVVLLQSLYKILYSHRTVHEGPVKQPPLVGLLRLLIVPLNF